MGVLAGRDPAELRERIREWIAQTMGGRDVVISEIEIPATTGFSHETVLFDASRDGRTERLVVRMEQPENTVFLGPDFEGEYRVMRALAERTDVPLPQVYGFEQDPAWLGGPFYVVSRIDGVPIPDNPPYTFSGWLADAPPEDQARVWWNGLASMARVHRADFEALGLGVLARPRYGTRGLDEQLGYQREYLDWVTGGERFDPLERALRWLDAHRPPERSHALCWGDSRLGNQMFRGTDCVAVLDWEIATIAPPEMDLGWWLYFDRLFSEGLGQARLAGFPSRDETVSRYGAMLGRSMEAVEYYELFAAFRFAVILMRVGQLMVLVGQLPSDTDFGSNSFAMQFLVARLEEVGA